MKIKSIFKKIWYIIELPLALLAITGAVQILCPIIISLALTSQGHRGADFEYTYERTLDENTVLITLIGQIICIIVFLLSWKKERTRLGQINSNFTSFNAVTVIFFGIALNIVLSVTASIWLFKLFPSDGNTQENLKHGSLALKFLRGCVGAVITEELCFRGFVYTRLKKYVRVLPAMLLSSFIFGLTHLYPVLVMTSFVLGMICVIAYEKFKTLWAPVAVHFGFNMSGILIEEVISVKMESHAVDTLMILLFVVSLIFIGVSMYFLFKKRKIKKENNGGL